VRRPLAALFAVGLLASGIGRAETPTATSDIGAAESALDAFHAALAAGDREAALARLAPEVVIFEAGGAELSRDEYAEHHLDADMEFLAATSTSLVDRRSGAGGDLVWVLTRTKTSGSFRGKDVATSGVETALLARSPDGWRITHLHWSSRRAQE